MSVGEGAVWGGGEQGRLGGEAGGGEERGGGGLVVEGNSAPLADSGPASMTVLESDR